MTQYFRHMKRGEWNDALRKAVEIADIAEREESQPAHESTPEAEAMASNLLDVAVAELQHMSEKNRAAYVLLKEEGLSAREAAAMK